MHLQGSFGPLPPPPPYTLHPPPSPPPSLPPSPPPLPCGGLGFRAQFQNSKSLNPFLKSSALNSVSAVWVRGHECMDSCSGFTRPEALNPIIPTWPLYTPVLPHKHQPRTCRLSFFLEELGKRHGLVCPRGELPFFFSFFWRIPESWNSITCASFLWVICVCLCWCSFAPSLLLCGDSCHSVWGQLCLFLMCSFGLEFLLG